MKKAIAILFSFFYLISSAGISVNLHYCGGKVQSVSFFDTDKGDCCKGKMKKKDCCKEKSLSAKKTDTPHFSSAIQIPSAKQYTHTLLTNAINICFPNTARYTFYYQTNAPPDLYQSPTYLRNRVLLI